MWLAVSGFMVMGLVSGWSLANHSNSESFLVLHGGDGSSQRNEHLCELNSSEEVSEEMTKEETFSVWC